MERQEMEAFYRRYLQRCNERRFAELGEFVAEDVEVNGSPAGLAEYAGGLAAVIELVPDFQWELEHLLIDGSWLSARLIDTGTTPTGRSATKQELAMYRLDGGRIVQCWGDLDREQWTT
ncbi:protein of unknown function DUF1486 [Kribbella flavida DSM 17836]|uniref:SnoaL-like domain-containing protein n=1 Tax=Kribbella flavida (strain DSM 17836 / JCM 10339 / NBRC 14399) TaxID=479435 RepID=D2PQR5_KRIFD|nr:ester cyclase [Kribbella flavida]ADB31048.1 protein of unknown function DUF1486 [Kribbella flavida DSM 17836]